ncbi:MAG: RrF2 family transcriptional regulator [Ruminiclostridium sp.]
MRILTKVECGLIIMTDIAANSVNGDAVTLYNIASRQNISIKYLEQIVALLRQNALLRSIKGPHGGYLLSRNPEKISIKEIIDAIDITVIGNDISEIDNKNSDINEVMNELIWDKIEGYLISFTSSLTLKELVDSYKQYVSENEQELMYYI